MDNNISYIPPIRTLTRVNAIIAARSEALSLYSAINIMLSTPDWTEEEWCQLIVKAQELRQTLKDIKK